MVYASLATIPGREGMVWKTVESLSHQVDEWHVADKPVRGRMDDSRKFWPIEAINASGYVLICDDDIIYPMDYVRHMLDAVDRYDRKAIVSLMGRVMLGRSKNYYTDRRNGVKIDWRDADGRDFPVHIPGTGVMAYHTDLVTFTRADFPHENMADILVGIKCAKECIPIMRVAPPENNWLDVQDTGGHDIWTLNVNDCKLQTMLVNDTEWPQI